MKGAHGRSCGGRRWSRPATTRSPMTLHPRDAAGLRPSRSRSAHWRSGYYSVTLTAGDERADAFLVVRPAPDEPSARRSCSCSRTSTWNAYNDWGGPSLYTGRHPGLVRAPARARFPREARAGPPQDAARARPRGAAGSSSGREPLGLSVWSGGAGWWNWERPFLALGGGARLPGGRRDQPGPRAAPRACSTATGCR